MDRVLKSQFALSNQAIHPWRLAYSFVHDQFNAEFNQGTSPVPRKVQELHVSDDFIDLTTRPGFPYFTVEFRGSAHGACFTCDGLGSTPDIRMSFRFTETFADGINAERSKTLNFAEGEVNQGIGVTSRWLLAVMEYLSDCQRVTSIEGQLKVIDRDSFLTFGDDRLTTLREDVQPNCSSLQNNVTYGMWGHVDGGGSGEAEPVSGQSLTAHLSYRIMLNVR